MGTVTKKFTFELLEQISPYIDQIAYNKEVETEKFMKTVDKFIYDFTGDDSILDAYTKENKADRIEKFNSFVNKLKDKHQKSLKKIKKIKEAEGVDHRVFVAMYVSTLIIGHMIEKYPDQMNYFNEDD